MGTLRRLKGEPTLGWTGKNRRQEKKGRNTASILCLTLFNLVSLHCIVDIFPNLQTGASQVAPATFIIRDHTTDK